MELDFGQLGYLLAIEQEASFTGAAARPKMSRPTLSKAIAQLEREIGSTVLSRASRRTAHRCEPYAGRSRPTHRDQMDRAVQDVLHHRAGNIFDPRHPRALREAAVAHRDIEGRRTIGSVLLLP
jgi:regulatory helix-turn-helix LysR family protein